jgi:hypothetical protein
MAFGMKSPTAVDFAERVKYDARAGRFFNVDYNIDTRETTLNDITQQAKFAFDIGSIEVGYAHFATTGPDFRVVPEGQPLPPQPMDKDDQGRLMFKPTFRAKLYGSVLGGLREWSSAANAVLESVDDVYNKSRAAPEAQSGKIPIIQLTKSIPVQMGKGVRQTVVYTPCFAIVGWTERVAEMGPRTVPVPSKPPVTAAAPFTPQGVTSNTPLRSGDLAEDEIPF